MAITGIPVVVKPSGGLAVTVSSTGRGILLTPSASGMPVTIVGNYGIAIVGLGGSDTPPNYAMLALPASFALLGETLTPITGYTMTAAGATGANTFTFAGQSATLIPPTSGAASYAYITQSNFLGSLTHTLTSVPIGTATTRVIIAVGIQNVATVASATIDPAGANIAMTARTSNNPNDTMAWFDAVVPGGAATRDIRVILNAGGSAFDRDVFVWTATGLTTGHIASYADWVNFPPAFAVTAGDFLFSASRSSGAQTWAGSTQVPAATHLSGPVSHAADWSIAASNAAFHCYPDATGVNIVGYAVYR